MATECPLSFSVASVMEDVLQQHDNRPRDLDLDSRRAEEATTRRYEAAAWLRKLIGVVGARELHAHSLLRKNLGLLYLVINKVDPGAVPKVVESPCDSAVVPDGAALSIYQCFENGGKYSEWKQTGGNGTWKFGGNVKPITSGKNFIRKNSEPFIIYSRNMSMTETSTNAQSVETENSKMPNSSLNMLVRAVLLKLAAAKDTPNGNRTLLKSTSDDDMKLIADEEGKRSEEGKRRQLKLQTAFDGQEKDINELKQTLTITKAGMQFMQIKFHEEIQNLGLHIHGLASAASGYHRVLEENRKLYNQVQDLKGNIRVYCRVRPSLGARSDFKSVVDSIEEETITVNTPEKYGKGCRTFNFNKVFGPSATQAEVFADTRPLIRSVLDGYNVCIFAYGQTGSGKTHTMTGPKGLTETSQGVNYRALSDLFNIAEQRKDTLQYDFSVQMIEIYNDQVRDLLVTEGLNKRLKIRNNSENGFNVPDASLVHVSSMYDVIDLMNLGHKNRVVGATALSDRSSRSHSCLTVHVQGRDLTSGAVLRGCMHLVDLAGSERVDKSEVAGERLKEAQHINRSLSALGDVISSLSQKNSHVPYRNSKLTQLLQDSLGGQAKTLMFVHISPELNAVGETLSTLKFAERVATVELGAAQVHKDTPDVKELKEQIANLKRKEGDQEHKVSRTRSPGGKLSSRSPPILQNGDSYFQMDRKSRPRQKTQSLDLDELLANSPPWPPITSPGQTYDKDTGSGDWVDKVMVNKQDRCWEAENDQKYVPDSSKLFSEQCGNGGEELEAATSDSSERDLLWQFNHSKLPTLPHSTVSRLNNSAKSPDLRSMLPSPSTGSHPQRGGRQGTTPEMKKKGGTRK